MSIVVKPKDPSGAAELVPNGTYSAKLTGVRQFENTYGPRLGFEFTLEGEGVEGKRVMRSCSPNLSPTSKLAEVLRGLLGRDLTEDESQGIDIEELVGTKCRVLVLQSQGKSRQVFSNVEQVFR